jgi:hypothetical protein
MTTQQLMRALATGLAFAALAAAAPAAQAVVPGQWETLASGAGEPGTSDDPGLHRTPDGVLHVAWVSAAGPLSESLLVRRVSAAGSLLPGTSTVVSGWVDVSDGAFVDDPGGLRIFFGGQQSTVTGTPLGVMTAPAAGAGWGPPAQLTDTYGTVSAASAGPGVPLLTFESQSRVALYAGLAPGAPLSIVASGVTDGSGNVVVDSAGRGMVVWCAFGADAGGIYAQEVEATTAQPNGSLFVLPGSTTSFGGQRYSTCVLQTEVSRRMPAVARAGGGVYVAGSTGYPTLSRVVVWRVGAPAGRTVASQGGVSHREPQLAADRNGRIWAGWVRSGRGAPVIVVRRSNRAASVFGAPVTVRAPRGWTLGSFESSATAARLDVIAQLAKVDNTKSLQHTVAYPGLTLQRVRVVRRPGGRRAVTYRVLDAGDPVARATVRAGAVSGRTAANGRVTLVLRGSIRATATKAGFTRATI